MTAVAASTGLRRSELLGLRWQDVDFKDGVLRVRAQLAPARADRAAKLVPLKSGAGEREVYLVPELAALLRKHKPATRHSQDADFVFCTAGGRPLGHRNVNRDLRTAGDRAGLNRKALSRSDGTICATRRSSRLIAAGLDVVQVQRQAGHSKPSITLDVYSHELERAKRSEDIRARVAAATSAVLGGAS